MKNRRTGDPRRLNVIAAAVAACFSSQLAFANPTGPTVANGQVTFHQQGNLLQITNSPNAIINWQSFSIGSSEITRFLQQSASSAVLNRVTTQNPSSILGMLQSNGRVFLINPNGILFGPGSQVDVAGLIASTLNLSDQDFLAGRLRFTEVPGAGSVVNQGAINATSGGQVYLVGPAVRNEGVITSPNGEVILAAGNSVELVNPGTPNLRVEINAPDNEAVNLGQIAADAGRVGIYAGLITQSGTVQANTAQVTEDGRIVLKATKGVNLETGSMTAASGVKGGNVTVETETGTIRVAGKLDASGSQAGGSIHLAVTGQSGGIDLSNGLNAGNAVINVSGSGHTVTLSGDMITAGAEIAINDSVVLGAPASITLDTTNGGAVAGGANISIAGAVDDDSTGSTAFVLNAGTGGMNAIGGAIGTGVPIASLTINGNATFLGGGAVTTTGDQSYNSPVTQAPSSLAINSGGNVVFGGNIFSGSQLINAAGDITLTPAGLESAVVFANGSQWVTAGGALNVLGGADGSNRFVRFTTTGDQNVTASNINIAGGGGTNNSAQIDHQAGSSGNQTITINGGGTLSIQGGVAGADNFAVIRNDAGIQQIDVGGGAIMITGGSSMPPDTGNNFARIENRSSGMQTVNAHTIALNGGPTGDNNFAGLQGVHQQITTTGDVTLVGGGGESSGARIGAVGNMSATDVILNVGGNLTLTGGVGSGATIGSSPDGGRTTDIVVTAAGDITTNPGSGSGVRIGSPSGAMGGGNISLTSTNGNIALNSAGGFGTAIRTLNNVTLRADAITQGDESAIQANQLTVNVNTGANLSGANQLSAFNATGGFLGGVTLDNGSPLLTVTGIDSSGGPLTLNQSGDLTFTGGIFSGPQSIIATGDISVMASSSTNVSASGSQTVTAGGTLTVQGAATGTNSFARLSATGNQSLTAAGISVIGGGGDGNSAEIRQLDPDSSQIIAINGGGTLELQGGSGGSNNFARIRNEGMSQHIDFSAGGAIVMTGGSGASNDFVHLRANSGTQTITGRPAITMTGGTGGVADAGNQAQLRAVAGAQTIFASDTIITAGSSGFSNTANLSAPFQMIDIDGGLTITGGGSMSGAAQGGAARIGGTGGTPPGATNLTLQVSGDVTLTGGSLTGASIGSSTLGGTAPSDITMFVGGNLTLNPGGGGARIGSGATSLDGGNIFVATGGAINFNGAPGVNVGIRTTDEVFLQANTITQSPHAEIVAGTLTTNTINGSGLGGNNQVAVFNATNTFDGDIVFNNTSPLLTVTGIQFGAGLPPPPPLPGALTLTQGGDLTLTGNIMSGAQSISATGDILVEPSSPAFVHAFGPQVVNAGGGLIVRSSPAGFAQVSSDGGQTIDAAFVEVTAQGSDASIINFGSGLQVVRTTSTNFSGEGLTVRNFGGPGTFARISQVGTGEQTIIVRNADQVSVNGIDGFALIGADLQTISVTGAASANAINLGSPSALGSSQIFGGTQSITAGLSAQAGSITIYGGDAPNEQAIIVSGQGAGSQTVSTSGTLTVKGGTSPFGGFPSGLFANGTGGQNIKAQGIVLQGGSSGAGNSAVIRNNAGDQHIRAPGGAIVVAGGSSTGGLPQAGNNFARIENRSLSGVQTVESDTITMTGGLNGESNFAGIQAAHQLITTSGDVTLVGGGGSVTGARIGAVGSTSPTDLKLNVGGKLTLTGGTETDASLGANRDGGQRTDVTVTVAGDITLNPGINPGANARIGSPEVNVAGGNISLTSTGGNIALNSVPGIGTSIRTLGNVTLQANAITQGDESTIQADRLTTVSNAGTSLGGSNQVAVFNAANGAIGGVLLHNASPSLTVTGVSTIPGPFTLNQDGDLAITGNVWSGPQSINVSGDLIVGSDSNSVILYAAGPRTGMARGEPHASWKALGVGLLDRLAGHSPINISARSLSVQGGSQIGSFAAITGGPINITTTGDLTNGDFSLAGGSGFGAFGWVLSSKDINLNIGGNLRLDSGTGLLSFARMQTVHPTSKIKVYFPNLSSGGYFVNGVEGAYRDGLSGFFAGPLPAKPGKRLITSYGLD